MSRQYILFTLIVILIFCTQLVSCQDDDDVQYMDMECLTNDNNVTAKGTYINNTRSLLLTFNSRAEAGSRFSTHSVGAGEDQVNGLFLCRPDISLATCHLCVKFSVVFLAFLCEGNKEGIVWHEECMMRYSDRSIFATMEVNPWRYSRSNLNVSSPDVFPTLLNGTMQKLIQQAGLPLPNNTLRVELGKANFTAFEGLYAMVMCVPGIMGSECVDCLKTALDRNPTCCGGLSQSAIIVQPSCQLRYDTAPFILPWPTSKASLSITLPPAPAPAPTPPPAFVPVPALAPAPSSP